MSNATVFINGIGAHPLTGKPQNYVFNPNNFDGVFEIGSSENGLKDVKPEAFQTAISDSKEVDIILNCVSYKEFSTLRFYLFQDYDAPLNIAENFIAQLAELCKGKKVKIFSPGSNEIHDYTSLFENGSQIISLGDSALTLGKLNHFSKKMDGLVTAAQEAGGLFKYLLSIALLIQKTTSNSPVISIKKDTGEVEKVELKTYTNKLLMDHPEIPLDDAFLNILSEGNIVNFAELNARVREIKSTLEATDADILGHLVPPTLPKIMDQITGAQSREVPTICENREQTVGTYNPYNLLLSVLNTDNSRDAQDFFALIPPALHTTLGIGDKMQDLMRVYEDCKYNPAMQARLIEELKPYYPSSANFEDLSISDKLWYVKYQLISTIMKECRANLSDDAMAAYETAEAEGRHDEYSRLHKEHGEYYPNIIKARRSLESFEKRFFQDVSSAHAPNRAVNKEGKGEYNLEDGGVNDCVPLHNFLLGAGAACFANDTHPVDYASDHH